MFILYIYVYIYKSLVIVLTLLIIDRIPNELVILKSFRKLCIIDISPFFKIINCYYYKKNCYKEKSLYTTHAIMEVVDKPTKILDKCQAADA